MLYVFLGRADDRSHVEHRVIHCPRPRAGRQLERRRPPAGVEMRCADWPRLKPCTFRTHRVISLPDRGSLAYERLGIADEQVEQL